MNTRVVSLSSRLRGAARAARRCPAERRPRSARLVGLIDRSGVDHERMVERFVEALLQPLVQPGRQQPAALGGHAEIGARLQGDRELEVLARQIQTSPAFLASSPLQQLDQQTHLAGDAERQRSRDLVPVALVEE